MDKEMISTILTELDIAENSWVAIENKIPLLFLSQDGNIYSDDKTQRFRFNSSKQLVEIVYGKIINNTFFSLDNKTSNFTPDAFISYELIAGIIRSVYAGPNNTYFQIPFK